MWTSERRASGRLCVVLLLAITQFPALATAGVFTLASWNIEHLAAGDGQGCRARDAAGYQAIRRYLERINADVIAFQEVENLQAAQRVFPGQDYDIHISTRPTQKFSQCYDSPNHRLMQRTGFAVRKNIGARLGLKVARQADVEQLQGSYNSGRWGVHLVLEQAGGRSLHLLSIHLKSRCTYQATSGSKANDNCRLLREQVEVLADWISARNTLRQNFIIAGDFNRQLDQLSDEVWQRLEFGSNSGAYVDLEKALHGVKHPKPYNRKYPFAIDHVIYNQALDALASEEKTYFDIKAAAHSDHLPLISTCNYSPPPR